LGDEVKHVHHVEDHTPISLEQETTRMLCIYITASFAGLCCSSLRRPGDLVMYGDVTSGTWWRTFLAVSVQEPETRTLARQHWLINTKHNDGHCCCVSTHLLSPQVTRFQPSSPSVAAY